MRLFSRTVTLTPIRMPAGLSAPPVCPVCQLRMEAGERVAKIPLGPGASQEDRELCREGKPYAAVLIWAHCRCIDMGHWTQVMMERESEEEGPCVACGDAIVKGESVTSVMIGVKERVTAHWDCATGGGEG